MAAPWKLESVPPATVMSLSVKSVLSWLRVKVMVAVSPWRSCVTLLVTAMVGGVVSTAVVLKLRVTWLLTSWVVFSTPDR